VSHIEIYEKADSLLAQFEVRHQLRFVQREQAVHGFHFDYHRIFNQEVDSISQVDGDSLVLQRQQLFGLERQLQLLKFVTETNMVRSFQQAGTKARVHFKRCTEYCVCNLRVDEVSVGPIVGVHIAVRSKITTKECVFLQCDSVTSVVCFCSVTSVRFGVLRG